MKGEILMSRREGKISIIVAVIGLIGVIGAAIIGAKWGKENVTVIVQLDGKNVVLNNEDVKKMAKENEQLNNEISEYKEEIEKLQGQGKELATKLGAANGELNDVPSIEYRNFGLSIDGEEMAVNKDKSAVLINGRKYYSKDFVDNLLPSDKAAVEKDDMLYVGKVVKEKSNLFDRQLIGKSNDGSQVSIETNVKDTYGNMHDKAVVFSLYDNSITFNANKEYSKFKCILNVLDGNPGGGIIQIESEQGILYTSEEVLSTTEPVLVDIPINYASSITIMKIGNENTKNMVTDAVLYNEE